MRSQWLLNQSCHLGMSACVDLALALVESDLGAEVARRVARQLVVYHRQREGSRSFQ